MTARDGTSGEGPQPSAAASDWMQVGWPDRLLECLNFFDVEGTPLPKPSSADLRRGEACFTAPDGEEHTVKLGRIEVKSESPIDVWRGLVFALAAEAGVAVPMS